MTIHIIDSKATDASARLLLDALSKQLAAITGDDGRSHFSPEVQHDGDFFLLAMSGNGAVGCGALRALAMDGALRVGEIKRMYAHTPGQGIGSALLVAIEQRARAAGYNALWLSTRRVNQAALAFYKAHGFSTRDNYGPYVGRDNSVCLSKLL